MNPIEGFGGMLALHGTDTLDPARYGEAVSAGHAARRLVRALERFAAGGGDASLVAAPGVLGAEALAAASVPHSVLAGFAPASPTTRDDTIAVARRLATQGVDVILFAGGDGTATDLAEALGETASVIGVPSGVKMHSEVFSRSPEAAGRLLADFVAGRASVSAAEVLDVGAEGETGVVGVLRVPRSREALQGAKTVSRPQAAEVVGHAIAHNLVRAADPATTWIVGPGTTTGTVGEALGFAPTLRGVDVRHPDGTVELDVTEQRLYEIVVSAAEPLLALGVVGGQGFLLGRGNQELSARVIAAIGADRVRILATEEKVGALFPPVLLVDSDPAGHGEQHPLLGYRRVHTGPRQSTVLKVVDAAA
ncbi:NAD(+)/NADH kinase [Microbacterium sp. CFH 31415]|uniref:ATP-NAD kinase family protein n=1 Tax=Microbacterium sp. CFH 31415 TaxID=2921732 RepID=UPI001F12A1FC|nr:NAD(+)/NADH kinase [Microbacterium sp. CFH 31415]MCH6230887.1 NAD(+)/NADH kinase [Microbacterium sp. CFH 31415]